MKTATIPALLVAVFLGACQPEADEVQPDVLRNEPVTLTTKDVELAQSTLAVSYEKVFNVARGLSYGVTKAEISVDVSDIRSAVEAFIAAHPNDYGLYFRLELRENQPDSILPDGSRKLRAGAMPGTISVNEGPNRGGPSVYAKQAPYAWNQVAAELQIALREMLLPRLQSQQALKLMLSVYDTKRFSGEAEGKFDGGTAKSHADGGSRVLYRGWNLEVK